MRILQIPPRLCWPLDTGAKLRNFHLARVLAERASVSLLTFSDREPVVPELEKVYEKVITIPRIGGYSASKMVQGALGKTPLPILNYTSQSMKAALKQLLDEREFDVIQVESIHLINYLPIIRAARRRPVIVCDWHNIESDLMLQYGKGQRNLMRRAYASRTTRLMKRFEKQALREFDAHLCVTEHDADQLRQHNPQARVFVIENGVDVAYYSQCLGRNSKPSRNRILFVGSMDYFANADAARFFARNIWAEVHDYNCDLKFTIVGKDPSPFVKQLASIDGVEVTGSVDDVRAFYCEAVASVVPLRMGGGSRLKILESMAAGVPVISTGTGAKGLEVRNGENILIAENRVAFVEAIRLVIEDQELRERLVARGRALIAERYDWSSIGSALFKIYENLMATSSAANV